jgi:hypothetical protein
MLNSDADKWPPFVQFAHQRMPPQFEDAQVLLTNARGEKDKSLSKRLRTEALALVKVLPESKTAELLPARSN